jgi:hypothetical protein
MDMFEQTGLNSTFQMRQSKAVLLMAPSFNTRSGLKESGGKGSQQSLFGLIGPKEMS